MRQGVPPHHEEGACTPIPSQQVEHLGRPLPAGAVVEGERDLLAAGRDAAAREDVGRRQLGVADVRHQAARGIERDLTAPGAYPIVGQVDDLAGADELERQLRRDDAECPEHVLPARAGEAGPQGRILGTEPGEAHPGQPARFDLDQLVAERRGVVDMGAVSDPRLLVRQLQAAGVGLPGNLAAVHVDQGHRLGEVDRPGVAALGPRVAEHGDAGDQPLGRHDLDEGVQRRREERGRRVRSRLGTSTGVEGDQHAQVVDVREQRRERLDALGVGGMHGHRADRDATLGLQHRAELGQEGREGRLIRFLQAVEVDVDAVQAVRRRASRPRP